MEQQIRRFVGGDDEVRELVRAGAGLLLGAAFAMLFLRRSGSLGDSWAAFPLLIVLVIPAIGLYGFGILASRVSGPRPWQSVYIVFGLVFILASLYQLLDVIGGNDSAPLNTFWIFAVVAGAAFYAGLRAGVRYALLAGGLAVLVSLLGLFDELLPDGLIGDLGTFRGVCILIAVGLGAVGLGFVRRDPVEGGRRGGELLTASGLAFVIGAGFVSTVGLAPTLGPIPAPGLGAPAGGANSSLFWDLVLLVGSVGLVVAGSRFDARGPCYVGALGLLLFVFIAGFDFDDPTPEPSLLGWPLILLLLGAAGFAFSILGGGALTGMGRRAGPGPSDSTSAPDSTAVHEAPAAEPPPDTSPPSDPPASDPPPPEDPPPAEPPPPR